MQKISHYDFGFAKVEVIRPDITDEERSKILQRALTPFYHACVDAGITATSICKIEKGHCVPSLESRKKIAAALDCDLSEFVNV